MAQIASYQPSERSPIPPGIMVDRQIRFAKDNAFLTIDPFSEESLSSATYDLGIGDTAIVSTRNAPLDLSRERRLLLEPFSTALVFTDEILKLSNWISGRIGPRSNLLQHGIFVSAGPQIDPGFSGRLFVTLINITEQPFAINYRSRFLSIEFHVLSERPEKPYHGEHQNKTEFTENQINAILGRGSGTSLKDIHTAMLKMRDPIDQVADFSRTLPDTLGRFANRLLEKLGTPTGKPSAGYHSVCVPVNTFGSEPFKILKTIEVTVEPSDTEYVATWYDANLSTSGETTVEAVENLKSLILDVFTLLKKKSIDKLGPEPKRQLAVLSEYLKERD